ncbi:hypothetical protein TNCT_361251 [Trichonephila clavata]|uniref:Uncharacterized protein n=1 Tax=Trichonephila clavata TaxID=2740835 RepID=A0A8X6HU77_TRICU|nr:hypothetical protein TNCT_361251 [Trichonephila clavata]
MNQQTRVNFPVSLTSDEHGVNSNKKIKPEYSDVPMLHEFECHLDFEDMNMEETQASLDNNKLLEVEQLLDNCIVKFVNSELFRHKKSLL